MNKGAFFTPDGLHRTCLWRIWDTDKNLVVYIGLNPSTANANKNDPTITRLIQLTKDNGYGGFYMHNLFTLISSKPKALYGKAREEVIHPDHEGVFEHNLARVKTVVFCWSTIADRKELHWRALEIMERFPNALCFGRNQNGSPKHPLYLPSDTKLRSFIDNGDIVEQEATVSFGNLQTTISFKPITYGKLETVDYSPALLEFMSATEIPVCGLDGKPIGSATIRMGEDGKRIVADMKVNNDLIFTSLGLPPEAFNDPNIKKLPSYVNEGKIDWIGIYDEMVQGGMDYYNFASFDIKQLRARADELPDEPAAIEETKFLKEEVYAKAVAQLRTKPKIGSRVWHFVFGWGKIVLSNGTSAFIEFEFKEVSYYVMGQGYRAFSRDKDQGNFINVPLAELRLVEIVKERLEAVEQLKLMSLNPTLVL